MAAACFDARALVAYLGRIVVSEPWAAVPLALGALAGIMCERPRGWRGFQPRGFSFILSA